MSHFDQASKPCRLCGSTAEPQDSHLIPRSILKRFFQVAPTGAARSAGEPNRRTQRFLNKPLLCFDCEQRFAVVETIWSHDIEQNLRRQLPWTFVCAEEHRYFAASLIWRTIVWGFAVGDDSPFTPEDRDRIDEAERKLREYLLGGPYHTDNFPWLHLITPPHGFIGAPSRVNVYLRGSLDASTNGYGQGLYTLVNTAAYLVVAVLHAEEALVTWTLGTELRLDRVVHVDPWRFPEDVDFRRLIMARAAALSAVSLSARQQAAVNERVETAIDPLLRYNEHVIATMVDYLNQLEDE
jgi:hypothetical protein